MNDKTTRFERVLPELFTELAVPRTPDYLEAAIDTASSRRQRPAWTFPERWLPMQITTQAAPVARMPWRQLAILAVLGLLVAIAAAVVAGAPQQRPAPLFGPAANGALVLSREGDIVAFDRASGRVTPLITGTEVDTDPMHSADGTQLVFKRRIEGRPGEALMVAKADGSGVRQITDPMLSLRGFSFSPDGRSMLVTTTSDNKTQIDIVPTDGKGEARRLAIPGPLDPDVVPLWHPVDGRELLLIQFGLNGVGRSVVAFDVATGAVRTIAPGTDDLDYWAGIWSPSGDRVLGGRTQQSNDTVSAAVFTADGRSEDALGVDWRPGNIISVSGWSQHGTRLIVGQADRETGANSASTVLTPDGSRPPVRLACGTPDTGLCPEGWAWSPDDTLLVGPIRTGDVVTGYVTADPDTGTITPLALEGDGELSFQRLAP